MREPTSADEPAASAPTFTSDSGTTAALPGGPFEFSNAMPKYLCPNHGETEHVIISNIEFSKTGKNTYWCMLCALDAMEKLGVPRVEPIGK